MLIFPGHLKENSFHLHWIDVALLMESQSSWPLLSASHIYCTSPRGPIFPLLPHGSQVHVLQGSSWGKHPQEVPCFESYFKPWSQVAFAAMQPQFTEKGITHATLSRSETELKVKVNKSCFTYCCCCMKMSNVATLQKAQENQPWTCGDLNHDAFCVLKELHNPQKV